MAQWLPFTNEKLYQCRLLADQAREATPDVLARALETAALQHLWAAYRSYLNELGATVSLATRVETLTQLMQEARLVTGEMRELALLADDEFSWLGRFLSATEQLGWPPSASASMNPGLIATASQSDLDEVMRWHQALNELIDRQRDNRHES